MDHLKEAYRQMINLYLSLRETSHLNYNSLHQKYIKVLKIHNELSYNDLDHL